MNIAIMNQRIVRGLAKSVSSPNSIRFLSTKKAGGVSGGAKKKVQNDSSKSENAALLKFYEKVQQVNSTKLPLSPERAEEHKRIGIEYNKRKMMRNNMVDKDISNKIWLQQEAMRALPMDLRQKAEVIDQSSPPVDRVMPLWDTPPIKGFNVDDYIQKKEEEEEEI